MKLALRWRHAEALLASFCEENSVGIVDMRAGPRSDRSDGIAMLRRRFCLYAKANGIGVIYIGRLLNLDHSTVTYHCNLDYRTRKQKGRTSYAERRARKERSGKDQGAGAVDESRD